MKTVLITGVSSGIGQATARYFLEQGWSVVGTVRNPKHTASSLNLKGATIISKVDITKPESLQKAHSLIKRKKIIIDVLVNNAGVIMIGAVETFSEDQIKKMFDTNLFGHLNTIKQFLPDMRKRNKGTIVNITSIGGKITFPLFGYYNASKHAFEALSEALWHDLSNTNIKVKVVEPGFTNTGLVSKGIEQGEIDIAFYNKRTQAVSKNMTASNNKGKGSNPIQIAKAIYAASTSPSSQFRYVSGRLSKPLLFLKWVLPDSWFMNLLRRSL